MPAPSLQLSWFLALVGLGASACDVGQSSAEPGLPDEPATSDELGVNSADALERCGAADLEWNTGHKTHYISYPEPGSVECEVYNGCQWAGLFAGCGDQRPEAWVADTNIAAVYPLYGNLAHHEICIRTADEVMIVNVIDTCSDQDCNGCCSANQGGADALVDLESYTNERWGNPDGALQWADLGPRAAPVCD
ncbi:MAG: hypothetical protein AAF799_25795 [Myxococcota bacterium]